MAQAPQTLGEAGPFNAGIVGLSLPPEAHGECPDALWEALRNACVAHETAPQGPCHPGHCLTPEQLPQGPRSLLSHFSPAQPSGPPVVSQSTALPGCRISKSTLKAWAWQKHNRVNYNSIGSVYFGRPIA